MNESNLNEYKVKGYTLFKNIISRNLLQEFQLVIEPWIDDYIDNWYKEGVITNKYKEYDFSKGFSKHGLTQENLDSEGNQISI